MPGLYFSRLFRNSCRSSGRNLLILNYVLDRSHPALAHQFDVVDALAKSFDKVIVLTGSYDGTPCLSNVYVESMNWHRGEPVLNIYRLFRSLIRVLRRNKLDVVFSHMTLIQSAILAPIFKLMRIPHFLWYAHTQESFLLHWVHFISNGIITSSNGSCPISSPKVQAIGQGIKQEVFVGKGEFSAMPTKCVHIGRTDPSKKIEVIINSVANARHLYPNLTLEIVGSPSNFEGDKYLESLKNKYQIGMAEGWLKFTYAIRRSDVPQKLFEKDIFVHAFIGSLDKSLIEATMAGLSVVTLNREYFNEFPQCRPTEMSSLNQSLLELLELNHKERKARNEAMQARAIANHSFENWVLRLTFILNQGAGFSDR